MKLKRSYIVNSPARAGRVRLVGEVTYDDMPSKSELYWFEFPEKYADSLSRSGTPWLICLAPLAVVLGEPLRICYPVDRVLFENIEELMRIWRCWYPHLGIVSIQAELQDSSRHRDGARVAAFFSGGVDSFFTVLRHENAADPRIQIRVSDLLLVWGFDIRLSDAPVFERRREILQQAASDLGKELIDVATNLRETRHQLAEWEHLSHGCALASVALALEDRYSKVLIASSHGYTNLEPWGSHPLTDRLLSTSDTEFVHDGNGFNRAEKTKLVAQSEIAMRSLRVCFKSRSVDNCGACSKCYRTMATLAAVGALTQCASFPEASFDVVRLAKVHLRYEKDRMFFREIRDLAVRTGRLDIVRAIDRCFRYSDRMDRLLPIVMPIIESLRGKRFFWRVGKLERALLAGRIL